MIKKGLFLNSLKYIVVSGASKGFNYLILLYFAIGIYSEQYVTILLLLSLEQILSLSLPLNNSSIIYSKKILDYGLITNKLITSSLLLMLFYIFVFFVFYNSIYKYFGVSNIFIFLSIAISVIINAYLVHLTNYYKLIEKHNRALKVQFLFFISFISIAICIFFIKNKVLAFFLGKAIGLFLGFIIIKFLNFNLTKFKFKILTLNEIKKIGNLFSVGVLGWLSGLGFMNLAKIYASPENLINIGYTLNLWNIFLLISTGINAVYHPLIKKYVLKNDMLKAQKAKSTTLFIYLLIAVICFLLYLAIDNLEILNDYNKVDAVFSVIPYTLLLFVFSSFYYVVHPFYLAHDKFGTLNLINIISHSFWLILMIISVYFNIKNLIWLLVMLYFLKCMFLYVYAEKKIIKND
ncbi:hypothetical protein [Polaribacter sargassicola]|uniref:hypothetical protein n=1 Tax=Polaribacter sargassicola TaxID=2836891 RepID=UPI001F236E49|nr:hypothetical protein [Polaribacter sp. DS7-9]MCG1035338.1 hypothetical protein [Polaribacter sp. DS7-9]